MKKRRRLQKDISTAKERPINKTMEKEILKKRNVGIERSKR